MPNFTEHLAIGAAGAGLVGLLVVTQRNLSSPGQFFLGMGLGSAVGSVLPDMLDPPTSPNHRGFFHSVTAGGGLTGIAASSGLSLEKQRSRGFAGWTPEDQEEGSENFKTGMVLGLVIGFLLHIFSDAQTPDGVPMITRGLI